MNETVNSESAGMSGAQEDQALQARLVRAMAISVALAVIISGPLAPWRVTTGLLFGGLLSLFNFHWMRSSIASLIEGRARGIRVSASASRYVLRYIVIAAVCLVAYKLQLVSLPATIAGLCSFVVALFVEASRQFYFAIVHREETN
jgi:ATP synthase I chain